MLNAIFKPGDPPPCQKVVVAGGDLPRSQFTAYQLVEQWEKEKPILRLYQENRRVAFLSGKGKGGIEASEAAPNDDDVVNRMVQLAGCRW